ncbi:hypothetical protein ACFY40_11425 [Streptomyces sp. NPDC012950]|uniref:hypothetical protein n=1 Tax=Streptomyces sp. NPDC012950 TaxID=3364858 RepID=UPI003684674E
MNAMLPYLGALLVAAAVAITWAARLWPARPVPVAAVRPDAPEVWLACHTTQCAHMTMRHDPAPAGLVCRGCGTVNGGGAG